MNLKRKRETTNRGVQTIRKIRFIRSIRVVNVPVDFVGQHSVFVRVPYFRTQDAKAENTSPGAPQVLEQEHEFCEYSNDTNYDTRVLEFTPAPHPCIHQNSPHEKPGTYACAEGGFAEGSSRFVVRKRPNDARLRWQSPKSTASSRTVALHFPGKTNM